MAKHNAVLALLLVLLGACAPGSTLLAEPTDSESPTPTTSPEDDPSPSDGPTPSPSDRREPGWCLDDETKPPYDGWTTYEDPFGRFSFEHPARWPSVFPPRSRHASGWIYSQDSAEKPESCDPWETWLPGKAKIEFSTSRASDFTDDPLTEQGLKDTRIDGRPAKYAIWRAGDEASPPYTEETVRDFEITQVQVQAFAVTRIGEVVLSVAVYSGNPGDADIDLFWRVLRSWRLTAGDQ